MDEAGKSKGKGREMDGMGEEDRGKAREVKKGGGEEEGGGRKEMARKARKMIKKEEAKRKKTRKKEDGKDGSSKSKAHPYTLRP